MYAFLGRHPSIRLGKPSSLDPKRSKAFNQPVVERYFEMLKRLVDEKEIPIENVYNMDEKGCQCGGGKKVSSRKFFIPRHRRPYYWKRSANLELITIIECVSADGTSLWPGFVFPGQGFHPAWFEVHDEITYVLNYLFASSLSHIFSVSTSPNGWTDDHLCRDWFEKSFIPQSCAQNHSGKPILLIYDGHGSHETVDLIDLGIKNNIILLSLPPHTTHKLQPLDVGVFGPFAHSWIERCNAIVADLDQEMPQSDFVKEYMAVREKTFSPSTIKQAWRRSGAWPICPEIFSEEDYAPSHPYSTTIRDIPEMPASFMGV